MNILLLPGNSPRNEEWIEEVSEKLRDEFQQHKILRYNHWLDDSQKFINMQQELHRLDEAMNEFSGYGVFAKSAGTILTLLAIKESILDPKFCVFVGSAVGFASRLGYSFGELISHISIPILFIQKTNDPACAFLDLKNLVESQGLENAQFAEVAGNDHHYGDVEGLRLEINRFVSIF
ncbi:hypothetical protein GF357_00230 [Candidatus Dojkabacteria bacterium]|nr:hypothetical protein [Candidatus Dojkabacteria bacterium]